MKRLVYVFVILFTTCLIACEDEDSDNKEPSVCECVENANEDEKLAEECEKMYENASNERQEEIKKEAEECIKEMSIE